jgi:hypothetical protein
MLTGKYGEVNVKALRKIMRNRYVFVSLFFSFFAISGFLIIPLPGGIPIVLKMFMVLYSTAVSRAKGEGACSKNGRR